MNDDRSGIKAGLNLGCGDRIFKSTPEITWRNLDIQEGPGIDTVMDWRNLGSIPGEEIVDIIVAHQTFEHTNCGLQPIKQCYEILKKGGSLIVSVPDLRKLAQLWLTHQLSTQIYLTNIYGPYDGTEASIHRWGFDHEYLMDQLKREAPWSAVKDFDYRAIPGADIARDSKWILCMEAIK